MTEGFNARSRVPRNSNGSSPVFHLSVDSRSQLLRWYNGNPFDTNEDTLKRALEVLHWCGENSGIFESDPEIRRVELETGAQTLGISVSRLAELMARESIIHQRPPNCRLIAFEGIDEVATVQQMDLLRADLVRRQVKVISLPSSDEQGFFGREVARLQNGVKAHEAAVDPKSMALWNALDRRACVLDVTRHAAGGTVVLLNRYTLSNAVHESARCNENLSDWVFEMEHTHLGIPAPDIYFVLDVPAVEREEAEQSAHTGFRPEQKDTATLVRQRYRELARRLPQIEMIECIGDGREAKSPDAVHREILEHLRRHKLLE